MEVLQRTANRGSIATGGYEIDNSIKLEEANNEDLVTTNQAAGDRKTWTFSAWVKRTEITYDYATIFGAEFTIIKFLGDDRLELALYNGTYYSLITTQKFRDTSAWYHIVAVCDTTQATASERSRLYVNGERVTVFDTSNSPPLNSEFAIGQAGSAGSGAWLRLGQFFAGSDYFNGYMAEVHYLNGTAAQASDFGEYDSDSGIWVPKEYTGGGYGTQGFYYKFDNSANLGEDSSGEGHDANSINNITSADQATDTPTNNFCTLNPLMENTGSANYLTLTEGATKTVNSSASYKARVASMGVTKGKWYWEMTSTQFTVVSTLGVNYPENWSSGTSFFGTMYVNDNGTGVRYNNSSRIPNFGNGWSSTTINIGFALDMDATPPTCTVYENGSSIGNLMAGLSINGAGGAYLPPKEVGYFPYISNYSNNTILANFGGYTAASISSAASDENGYGTFEYAPPSGYYALCTKNLAEYG